MARSLVLDANILVRAVLGTRVHRLLMTHAGEIRFLTVDEAFEDAQTYVPQVLAKHGGGGEELEAAAAKLEQLRVFVHTVPIENLERFESTARRRLQGRDEEDWPYLALALLLECPVWTEDTDFFGTGVAVWTTDRIALFFEDDGGKTVGPDPG